MQTVKMIVSAFIQIIVFSMVPFLWWIISARKKVPFFKWIGLKRFHINRKGKFASLFLITVILFSAFSFLLLPMLSVSADLATSQFAGKGTAAIIPAFVYAFLQTGLSEEILFRGFFGKRLINRFGFPSGNILQAILFGSLHGAMLVSVAGIGKAVVVIAFTGAVGWMMGYMDEKQSDGSILTSWAMHGMANLFSSVIAMFNLI